MIMNFSKLQASVDLRKSDYAVYEMPADAPEFDIHMVAFECTLPDYSISRKSFPYFAFELVTKGKGTLRLKGIDYPLHRGSVFTYGPGVPHIIKTDPDDLLEKYFLDLTLEATNYDSPIHQPGVLFETSRVDRLVSLFKGLLSDASDGVDDPRIRRETARLILDLASLDINRENPVNSPSYQSYLNAKSYIEEHYQKIGSLVELAAALKSDTSYLSRLFKRYGNQTPYQYIVRLRLSRACYLLKRHDMQIQEISRVLGFADPFHFSAVFKRHIGVSPRVYRTDGTPHNDNREPHPSDL